MMLLNGSLSGSAQNRNSKQKRSKPEAVELKPIHVDANAREVDPPADMVSSPEHPNGNHGTGFFKGLQTKLARKRASSSNGGGVVDPSLPQEGGELSPDSWTRNGGNGGNLNLGFNRDADDANNINSGDGVLGPSSSFGEVPPPLTAQLIREPGATLSEVRLIYWLKRCVEAKTRVSEGLVRIGFFQLMFSLVLLYLLVGVVQRKCEGPQMDVRLFLAKLNLADYTPLFVENKYEFYDDVINITEESELAEIGVQHKAERMRILRANQRVRNSMRTRRNVVLGVFWAIGIAAVITGTLVSMFPEARERVGCFMLWVGFMSWYRVRLWCRLWANVETDARSFNVEHRPSRLYTDQLGGHILPETPTYIRVPSATLNEQPPQTNGGLRYRR